MFQRRPILFLFVFCLAPTALLAAEKDWNRAANGLWSDNLNWSPNGIPGSTDDVFLGRSGFPSGFLTTLDVDDNVGTLTIMNGSRFSTGGRQFGVDSGPTTVTGFGSTIFVTPRTVGDRDSLDVEGLVIQNSGFVRMLGGILEMESGLLDIQSTGAIGGYGTIELIETGLGGSAALRNNGLILMSRTFFDPIDLTLTIQNFNFGPEPTGTGGIDLDGTTGNGSVDIDDGTGLLSGNMTLVIDAQITDAFDGTMDIGLGDTLDMRNRGNAWNLGSGGVINLNGYTGTATLEGESLTLAAGSRINVNSGVGRIETPLSANVGELFVGPGGTLHLAGTSTVQPGSLFLNSPSSSLEVSGTTNIVNGIANLDWDGQGGGSTTTVSGNGQLTINVNRIDNDDIFDGNINLEDSGQLSVTVSDGRWDASGVSTLRKNTSGTASLSGSSITFAGDVDVNAGTLVINPEIGFGGAPDISVASGATLTLNGLTSFTNTDLAIDGTLQLNGSTTWSSGGIVNGSGKIVNEGNSRFIADTTINVAIFDWDQGTTTVDPSVDLTIDVTRVDVGNDTFNNNAINVNSGSLSVSVDDGQWDLGTNGILTLNKSGAAIPALNGDRLNVRSGGEVRARGSEVRINAPLSIQNGGSLIVEEPTLVILGGPTTLAGGNITGSIGGVTVVPVGDLTVTGPSSIAVTTYDWDAGNTTVESAGQLNINVTSIERVAGEKYDSTLTLNSGNVNVNNAANVWTMDGTLNLNNTNNDIPVLSGDSVFFGNGSGAADAQVRVFGSGTSRISAQVFYQSDVEVLTGVGTVLEHTNNVTFMGGGSYIGNGELRFQSNVAINGSTTIDMMAGKIDFDPLGDTSGNTVSINAPFTLNVGELLPFGQNTTSGIHGMVVDNSAGGQLTVNSATGSWIVAVDGVLDLNSNTAVSTVVAGSDLSVQGTMNVTGDVGVTSKLVIGGAVNLNTPNEPLRLNGGSLIDPNLLVGGTIAGSGFLSTAGSAALHGFGTIDADVDFASQLGSLGHLKANDGTLTINSSVLVVGEIGTADADGILDVTNPWNTADAPVRMAGGEVRGATITNDGIGGILGNGVVSARVVNLSTIAASGGKLTLSHPSNDFGALGNQVTASEADVELQGALGAFSGSMIISAGNEVYTNIPSGFGFDSSSSLELSSGVLRSAGNVVFAGGSVNVNGLAESQINVEGAGQNVSFESGTTTTLDQDLRLRASGKSMILSGSIFNGGGTLINDAGSQLELAGGADVGVTLINSGSVDLASVSARADLNDFVQLDTGTLTMGLAGSLLTEFDRLVISGAAQLDGTLDVQLLSGFTPILGDTFPIVSTLGGVFGTFATESFPSLGIDLEFDINYDGGLVTLEVVSTTPPCDFDGGGDCDLDDIDDLYDALGTNDPVFDLDGNGIVDDADIPLWLAQASAADPSGLVFVAGDVDLNGAVEGSDFTALAVNFGTAGATWGEGNFDGIGGDGQSVGGSDFTALAVNFGFTSIRSAQAVPEPSNMGIVFLALLLVCRCGTARRCYKSRSDGSKRSRLAGCQN